MRDAAFETGKVMTARLLRPLSEHEARERNALSATKPGLKLQTGDVVTVDLDQSTVTVQATGKVYGFKPLGDVRPVVDAGGLFNFARKSGMIPANG